MTNIEIGTFSYNQVRNALLERIEIALLDVREEAAFAEAHPLFAANLPLSRLETEVYKRIPNRHIPLIIYDNAEGLALIAAKLLIKYGYKNVNLLEGGLSGWHRAGGEIFSDVNTPSKAFGELVESKRHTPSLSAREVKSLIDNKADVVIVDARRYDEYHTMNIPTSISVPGAELVLRIKELVPRPETSVIVNCAGRTRSIIGTQSLINAGIDNPVYALRNGTIGWTLAGQTLEHGQIRSSKSISKENREQAISSSIRVADTAGVRRINRGLLQHLIRDKNRTNYFFDVRTPEEYNEGHLSGFLSAPGGQLVQETDHFSPVRGARIVVYDNQEVRANMTASWLAQMAWEVYVLDHVNHTELTEKNESEPHLPILPTLTEEEIILPETLNKWLHAEKPPVVIDLATTAYYLKNHIPGAWFVLRSQLAMAIKQLPQSDNYVLTSEDGIQAYFTAAALKELTKAKVFVLDGGTKAWLNKEYSTESGNHGSRFASPQIDRYRRPYEGTTNSVEAMQAYLDWEYGLVEQLYRDSTHGFFVI